ncbi:MAG: hypothetical protein AB7I27_11370 [Bacteriovoracaceae bacterium]
MKKVLSLILVAFLSGLITVGILVLKRYQQNPEQIVPYPYRFTEDSPLITPNAPILIVGDRMALYFSKFKAELAETISQKLSKPIAIESLAAEGVALHRTLHQLKSLTKWPQIIIYQGASEEFNERKFELSEIANINQNFKRYNDEKIETLLVLHPWISRLVYEPVKLVLLPNSPQPRGEILEDDYLKGLDLELKLFEQHLIQLVNLSKDRNSLLILTTTPINLDVSPKKVCAFTNTLEIEKDLDDLKSMLKESNPKTAYQKSSKLIKQYSGNAQLFYMHGQISKALGLEDEARNSLLSASAFDCDTWRTTEVFNSIIRKVANENQVILFDFARMLEAEWPDNPTFFDDLYPQHLYYEKATEQLGLVIKQILKL